MDIKFIFEQIKKDIKDISGAIIFLIAYFVLLYKFFHSLCPVQILFGIPCPGCGMTRACLMLLKFDFAGAWRMHPGSYLLCVLLVCFCCTHYLGIKKMEKLTKALLIISCVFLVIFYIWRMYMYFPEQAPMTYYHHNILKQILDIIQ